MRKQALVILLVLILGAVPSWYVKPAAADTYVPIVELNQNFDDYAYHGDIVTTGVVTYVDEDGFMIQNGSGPYTGIYVYTKYYNEGDPVQEGDVVEVKGYPKYYSGLRELSVSSRYNEYYSVIGSSSLPEPFVIPTANYSDSRYQSVLVKFVDANITGRADSWYTKLWIDDGSGEAYVFSDENLPDELEPGARFKYFIGVIYVYVDKNKNSIYEVHPVEYLLYNPDVKIENVEHGPFLKDVPTKVSVTVVNNGSNTANVTFSAAFEGVTVYSTEFTLEGSEKKVVEFYVTPSTLGSHTLKITVEESQKVIPVKVILNPFQVSYGITPYYERLYVREMANVTPLYENFTSLVEELTSCGVNLGDIEGKVKEINATMNEIEKEYSIYTTLKNLLIEQEPGLKVYHYMLMVHVRKAALLSRKVQDDLEFVLPILQKTYDKVEPSCHPVVPGNETSNQTNVTPSNQTNVTPSNQTNVTPSTNVTIRITKVLIDASHGQYYNPTKTDQNGMSTLIDNIKNELGWIVEVNTEPITYEKLKDYDVLIITNPSEDITDEEAAAIKQFVEEGGGLFILGDSYYGHVYYKSLNRVVGDYGISFNNDELMDDDVNTGRAWFPLVGVYNLDHPAMKFLTEEDQLYYNGDTLTITGKAVWLIRGYETSYSEDEDGNIVYEKGSKPVVAAAVEAGEGRVVAYGSSRAISDAYYGHYINTNWPFVKGVLLWLAHEE
ncbi:hypothetical protein A3L12_05130 [Thermococcus sp. P6]|uniref:DUF4350 domain-containing protein n=1 Tax=Thermococcus sp. P6 TaxID=122420 RepID=UPI000B598C2C|nr:DUF4350 domain-containing protein [Thermococcus sp. P6]ASJ10723.1 hypothetical protein A3L12_05130 [Thermococcus sp. P6]